MADQVFEFGGGVSVVHEEDGSVDIIAPASSGDIEMIKIPAALVGRVGGALVMAGVSASFASIARVLEQVAKNARTGVTKGQR